MRNMYVTMYAIHSQCYFFIVSNFPSYIVSQPLKRLKSHHGFCMRMVMSMMTYLKDFFSSLLFGKSAVPAFVFFHPPHTAAVLSFSLCFSWSVAQSFHYEFTTMTPPWQHAESNTLSRRPEQRQLKSGQRLQSSVKITLNNEQGLQK